MKVYASKMDGSLIFLIQILTVFKLKGKQSITFIDKRSAKTGYIAQKPNLGRISVVPPFKNWNLHTPFDIVTET